MVKWKSKKIFTKKIRIVIYYLEREVRGTFDPIAVTATELKNKAFSMLEEVFETWGFGLVIWILDSERSWGKYALAFLSWLVQ